MTVLVIEDEKLLLMAITKKISAEGIDVVGCETSKSAFQKLETGLIPDLIWLDYYLADQNGLQVVTKIKQDSRWSHIPIMVVSNSASGDKVHNMLALGVDKYLLKADYRLEQLVAIVNDLIKP